MQISAVCEKYDSLEPGAPPFSERLEIINTLSKKAKRVIVRVQPYICDVFDDVKTNISKFAQAGAYGIIFEGMKFNRKKPGTEKLAGDFVIPLKYLKADFSRFKEECHNNGVKFYSGENRLRTMGDSMTCCGIDGLEGFKPNTFNLAHLLNGDLVYPTETMKTVGTAHPFNAVFQNPRDARVIAESTFADYMLYVGQRKKEYVYSVLGKEKTR